MYPPKYASAAAIMIIISTIRYHFILLPRAGADKNLSLKLNRAEVLFLGVQHGRLSVISKYSKAKKLNREAQ